MAQVYDFSQDNGERLAKLLTGPMMVLEKEVARGVRMRSIPIGNIRAEICSSKDGQFLAIQLFRFVDFQYQPLTQFMTFTGDDVDTIEKIIA